MYSRIEDTVISEEELSFPMTEITTVVFDAFGTLLQDGPGHWRAALEGIIRQQGLKVAVEELDREWLAASADFRTHRSEPDAVFAPYSVAWREGFAQAFRVLNLPGDAAAAAAYWVKDMGRRPAYPEAREALEAVSRNRRVVLLSNADDAFLDPALERLGFPFAAALSSEAARRYKPNPEFFRTLLRRLDLPAREALYVGDRQYEDVKGAGQVGMGTVWINRTGAAPDPTLPEPDYRVANLLELPALLDR